MLFGEKLIETFGSVGESLVRHRAEEVTFAALDAFKLKTIEPAETFVSTVQTEVIATGYDNQTEDDTKKVITFPAQPQPDPETFDDPEVTPVTPTPLFPDRSTEEVMPTIPSATLTPVDEASLDEAQRSAEVEKRIDDAMAQIQQIHALYGRPENNPDSPYLFDDMSDQRAA